MSRPIIFFSHSSRDKVEMNRLKESFVEKTGGSIEVFLSSDGESIPLGKNWVYRVQEGLEGAKAMLVFITPNSVDSGWIYFEAGYCFSKGIRVVPIGFLGMDFTSLGPPFGLLQGFNINSFEGLNNIIGIANDVLQHRHSLSFTDADLQDIVSEDSTKSHNPLTGVLPVVEDIQLAVPFKSLGLRKENALDAFYKILEPEYSGSRRTERTIEVPGATIHVAGNQQELNRFHIVADPLTFNATYLSISRAVNSLLPGALTGLSFFFLLKEGVRCVVDRHKITARLQGSEAKLTKDGLQYDDMIFETDGVLRSEGGRNPFFIRVTPLGAQLYIENVARLLNLLRDCSVIEGSASPASDGSYVLP